MNEIKEIRLKLGLSQTELAEIVGIHQHQVSEWETGKRSPRKNTMRLIRFVLAERFPSVCSV